MYNAMTATVQPDNVRFEFAQPPQDGVRELSNFEMEYVNGGAASDAEIAGIFGSAGFGAVVGRSAFTGGRIGATLGSFAGPAGALAGGIVGAGFGIGLVFVTRALF